MQTLLTGTYFFSTFEATFCSYVSKDINSVLLKFCTKDNDNGETTSLFGKPLGSAQLCFPEWGSLVINLIISCEQIWSLC